MWQFQNDVKDEVTIGATGMYIPIRAHFRQLLGMGLGYLHKQRGVCVTRSTSINAATCVELAGRVMVKTPAFLFTEINQNRHVGVSGYFMPLNG